MIKNSRYSSWSYKELSMANGYLLLYTDVPSLFSKYSATGHLLADHVQAYVHGPPSSQLLLASKIERQMILTRGCPQIDSL